MKKFLGIFILSFIFINPAISKNFNEDIETYYSKNSGMVSTIYGLNRCSGVLTYMASMLFKEPDQKKNALTYVKLSSKATEYASKLHSKHNNISFTKALTSMEKKMMQMDELYRKDAKENFLKKGRYISSIINSDIDYCIQVIVKLIESDK